MVADRMRRMNVNTSGERSKGHSFNTRNDSNFNHTRADRVNYRQGDSTGKKISGGYAVDKTKTKDFRCKQIRNSLLEMEKAVGIRSANSANVVNGDLPISDFVKAYMSFINGTPLAQRKKMVVELQSGLSSLQMINNYVRYYQELRINFVGFEAIREIILVLQMFKYNIDDVDTSPSSVQRAPKSIIKMKKVHYLNTLWTVLDVVDNVSTQARTTSYAYRYLRLFGVCLIINDYISASVIADILLEQIAFYAKLKGDK